MKKTKEDLDLEIEEVRQKQMGINRISFWVYTVFSLMALTLLVNNISLQFETKYTLINILSGILLIPIVILFLNARSKKKKLSVQRKSLIADLQADLAKTAKKKK